MNNNFDEAREATEELFDNGQSPAEEVLQNNEVKPDEIDNQESGTAEPPTELESGNPETAALDEATRTAETAAAAAAEKDGQLQQAMQEIEALKQQNQHMQGLIDEISKENTQKIADDTLTPPTLELSDLSFADEETQRAAIEKFAQELTAYNRKQLLEEISPAIEYAKKGMKEAEKSAAIEELAQLPQLPGLKDMLPQLEIIIKNNKWLQSDNMPTDEKYINAYAIARGVNSINTPPEPEHTPTTEELMDLYNNNPAFQELVEKQRLEQIKQSQQVPSFSASSGAVNAALNIKEKPKTLEEAAARTREMFGSM